MPQLYILHEHAAGYALFAVAEFEEVAMFLPQVEASVTNASQFKSIVKLAGFSPFKTAVAALENVNAISEGIVPQHLLSFLDDFFSKLKKKKCILGICDAKLGSAITEAIQVKCSHIGVVPEVIRGIRIHFHRLVKGFTMESASVAQLGLGHSYSRAKVKFNVHRSDNMIIQAIALLDQLDKDINTFSMRLREWYSYHFPELIKVVSDNYIFAKAVNLIKDRQTLTEDKLVGLEGIVMDSSKAQAIIDAAKMSMGMDISPIDLINIEMFSARVVGLSNYRKQLAVYLHNKMEAVAPNLQSLIGDQVGARLISHAGNLTNLAKCPGSTVQILGAEKALFRALKTKTNTPKYGLIYHSTFIGRAGQRNKGRISRFLANKCSIASRIDCFLESPTNVFGEALRQQVEDRLKFYESGEVPRKNIEVMKEAIETVVNEEGAKASLEVEHKVKKKKKKKLQEIAYGDNVVESFKNGLNEKIENIERGEENTSINQEEAQQLKKKNIQKRKHCNTENGSLQLHNQLQDTSVNQSMTQNNGEPKKKIKKNKEKVVD